MKCIITFSFFLFSFVLSAQTVIVVDFETNKPLEFVTIVGLDDNATVVTNGSGKASIKSLSSNKEVSFQLLGYLPKTVVFDSLKIEVQQVQLERSSFNLDKVIVSATRWEQSDKTQSQKIASLNAAEISFTNPQTSADLLEKTGEVFIQKSQQGGGSPMIRGFSTNRLLYSVDGVRMNTAIFRGGNIQNVISLDPFAMESVKVLFGPGAILYGSDAIGGVMSFSSKSPQLSPSDKAIFSGNASLRSSSANSEITSHLDFSIGLKKWGFLSSYSRSDFGDLKMGKNGPDDFLRDSVVVRQNGQDIAVKNTDPLIQNPTNYQQENFMQKIVFSPNRTLLFEYAFHLSETSDFDRFDRLTQKQEEQFRFAENKYGPQKWLMHQLSANYSSPTKWFDKAKLNLAYQVFKESRIDRQYSNTVRRERTEQVDALSLNVDLTKKLNDQHQLFYGVESVFNLVNSRAKAFDIITLSETRIQSRYPDSKWYSNALYISEIYQFNEKVSFEGGLRLNQYALNANFDTAFVTLPYNETKLSNVAVNGSLGVTYKQKEKWVLSSVLSTGFRAPNVDDMGKFFESEPDAIVVPNSNLKAEYSYNAEISATRVFNRLIKTDVSVFYTYLNNALVRRNFTLNGSDSLFFDGENKRVQAIQNAANATVYGLQAGIEIKMTKTIHWINRVNYQHGEEELENGETSTIRHAAPLFGTSKINFKKGRLFVQFSFLFSDEVSNENLNVGEQAKPFLYALDSNGNPYSPSWYTFNFMSQYKFNSMVKFSLGIENITDQRYRTYSSGVASAGRNFIFALKVNF